MTTIRTEDDELHELSLTAPSGQDYLNDVIGGSLPMSEDDTIDFDMTDEDYEWWKTWAANEQLINDTIEEKGLTYVIPNFYDEYHDWEDAQREYGKYLGIDLEEF